MKIKYLVSFIAAIMAVIFGANAHAGYLSQDIFVSNAWVQALPPSQTTTAAYMTITNNATKEAVLISAASDAAASVEIHEMSDRDGMMKMEMVSNIHVPARGKAVLKPGGYHIMLIGLKKPANKGEVVPITLHFQDGGVIMVNAHVQDQ